jgi:hypothetical protein
MDRTRSQLSMDELRGRSTLLASLSQCPSIALPAVIFLCWSVLGCEFGTRLVSETPSGGTVAYRIADDTEILHSSGRQEALRLMDEKCPNGYHVKTQGQIPRLQSNIDRAWSGQISKNYEDRMWGIEFRCK